MKRKGQVTIFVILAILVLTFVVIYFYVINNQKENSDSFDSDPVYGYVQSCLEFISEEVIYYVGQGGGYYFPPEISTNSGIPYYLIKDRNLFPSRENVENEISYFISEKLPFCIKNFRNFPEYNISDQDIFVESKIQDNSVLVHLDYPIYVSKGEATEELREFNSEIFVRMGIIHNSINEFLEDSGEEICLSCLYEISEMNDLFVDMFDAEGKTVIFIFKEENYELNDKPFEWVFANEY